MNGIACSTGTRQRHASRCLRKCGRRRKVKAQPPLVTLAPGVVAKACQLDRRADRLLQLGLHEPAERLAHQAAELRAEVGHG